MGENENGKTLKSNYAACGMVHRMAFGYDRALKTAVPMTPTIELDEWTESILRSLCLSDGSEINELAAKLLKRAIRAARPGLNTTSRR